jgi:lipoate-protein ligase A
VALPNGHAIIQGDIVTSYRRLSAALLNALEALGLQAAADKRLEKVPEGAKGPVCFEVPSDYEITANGRKLIGSAQVRRNEGVLQHGSLPLWGDIARICDALAFPDGATRERIKGRVRQRAATLESVLGRAVTWDEAVEALRTAFVTTFDLDLSAAQPPSDTEHARALELVQTTYGTDHWTFRL